MNFVYAAQFSAANAHASTFSIPRISRTRIGRRGTRGRGRGGEIINNKYLHSISTAIFLNGKRNVWRWKEFTIDPDGRHECLRTPLTRAIQVRSTAMRSTIAGGAHCAPIQLLIHFHLFICALFELYLNVRPDGRSEGGPSLVGTLSLCVD